MNRLVKVTLAFALVSGFALCAQSVRSATSTLQDPTKQTPPSPVKVMREYKGVKLGLAREEVHKELGNPATTSDNTEDFTLPGDNAMTVYYENGEVKALQISFLDAKSAPAMKDVVGETAEVTHMDNGATHARMNVSAEKFWVSYYRSKDGAMTQVTISRQ
ncbi:MAG: hypothetical protein J2P41_02095 [Blastocatellia bacterium]|nr:hypothetical protein [Blastocatellia bacterium]